MFEDYDARSSLSVFNVCLPSLVKTNFIRPGQLPTGNDASLTIAQDVPTVKCTLRTGNVVVLQESYTE